MLRSGLYEIHNRLSNNIINLSRTTFHNTQRCTRERRHVKTFWIYRSPAKRNINKSRLQNWNYSSDTLKQDGPQWSSLGCLRVLWQHTRRPSGGLHIHTNICRGLSFCKHNQLSESLQSRAVTVGMYTCPSITVMISSCCQQILTKSLI